MNKPILVGHIAWIATALTTTTALADHSVTALIKVSETIDVPAAEAGVLIQLVANEGQMVQAGTLLASVDAQKAKYQLQTVQQESDISESESENDFAIQLAKRANELAKKELERAKSVNQGLPNSISGRELNILHLTVEKTALEILQANHNQQIAKMNAKLKQTRLQMARNHLEKFQVRAPIQGLVVHIEKRQGEWVNPGDLVARIVRVDRVRAEAFVDADFAERQLQGKSVQFTMTGKNGTVRRANGEIVFVSHDVNPVDGRIRIWAELDNSQRVLRPGLNGKLTILSTVSASVEKMKQRR